MVSAATMPGLASGSSTFHTICPVVAPMDCAASTRPRSTSRNALSTSRAIKGIAAMVSGTTAAVVPIDEPTIKRVNGITTTSRMMNGTERTALTTTPIPRLNSGCASTPPRLVRCSSTPSGMPNSAPTTPEIPTITNVSLNDVRNRSNISDHMLDLLHHYALLLQEIHRRPHIGEFAGRHDRQRAEGLALDLVDVPVQDVEIEFVAPDGLGQYRLVHARAGERKPVQVVAPIAQAA